MCHFVCVCVLLSTGPWSMSESWGGGVSTSESDPARTCNWNVSCLLISGFCSIHDCFFAFDIICILLITWTYFWTHFHSRFWFISHFLHNNKDACKLFAEINVSHPCVTLCVCVCYCPPVHGVCLNHEVVEFQPRKVTPPEPRLSRLFLHSYYWSTPPSPPAVQCSSGGAYSYCPDTPSTNVRFSPHGILCPPGRHLSPSYHTNTPVPLHHPSIYVTSPSTPPSPSPRLSYSRRHLSLAAAKISSNVTLICFSSYACLHHSTRSLLHPSYPVSLVYTSKIVRKATHYAIVACLLSN